jgi:pyridoxamine 5'-phosphate oxidase
VAASREELDERYRQMEERFPGDDVPLPPHWGGFRLFPDTIEFWKGREHRLHDRIRYTRRPEGPWVIERLYP